MWRRVKSFRYKTWYFEAGNRKKIQSLYKLCYHTICTLQILNFDEQRQSKHAVGLKAIQVSRIKCDDTFFFVSKGTEKTDVKEHPLTCQTGQRCAKDTTHSLVGCCWIPTSGKCTLVTTCLDRRSGTADDLNNEASSVMVWCVFNQIISSSFWVLRVWMPRSYNHISPGASPSSSSSSWPSLFPSPVLPNERERRNLYFPLTTEP